MKITEDYVSFEVAKLLKEKGFDGVCRYYYPDGHTNLVSYVDCRQYDMFNNESCIAPTLQMACKWLREVHGIDIIIDISDRLVEDRKYYRIIWDKNNNSYMLDLFKTYEEACEAALKYVLENLI